MTDSDDDRTGADADARSGDASGPDGDPPEAPEGGWLVLAALVVGVLSMLLVGALLGAPLASQTTDLGIGFAWLLAAAYVGFRMEGRPRVRRLGATAFVAAAISRFVDLLYPHALLEIASLVGLVVGAVAMLVVARASD